MGGLVSMFFKRQKEPKTPSLSDRAVEERRKQIRAETLAGSADQSGTLLGGGGSSPTLSGGTKDLLGA